jgi:hypothetical protein
MQSRQMDKVPIQIAYMVTNREISSVYAGRYTGSHWTPRGGSRRRALLVTCRGEAVPASWLQSREQPAESRGNSALGAAGSSAPLPGRAPLASSAGCRCAVKRVCDRRRAAAGWECIVAEASGWDVQSALPLL